MAKQCNAGFHNFHFSSSLSHRDLENCLTDDESNRESRFTRLCHQIQVPGDRAIIEEGVNQSQGRCEQSARNKTDLKFQLAFAGWWRTSHGACKSQRVKRGQFKGKEREPREVLMRMTVSCKCALWLPAQTTNCRPLYDSAGIYRVAVWDHVIWVSAYKTINSKNRGQL